MVEMSLSSWLVAGVLPGVARQPMKKLGPDHDALLALICRWKDEASRADRAITRVCLAYEAGRDGFWLASWRTALRRTSFIRRASVSPASNDGPRLTGSIRNYSSVVSSDGCGVSEDTAAWQPSQPFRCQATEQRAREAGG